MIILQVLLLRSIFYSWPRTKRNTKQKAGSDAVLQKGKSEINKDTQRRRWFTNRWHLKFPIEIFHKGQHNNVQYRQLCVTEEEMAIVSKVMSCTGLEGEENEFRGTEQNSVCSAPIKNYKSSEIRLSVVSLTTYYFFLYLVVWWIALKMQVRLSGKDTELEWDH